MSELFEICPKIVFLTFWCFSRFEGVNLVRKGEKWSVLMCQGQPRKFPT